MTLFKRISWFILLNILIIATLSTVISVLGITTGIGKSSINYTSLAVFCAIWGFASAFFSLAISRIAAKWMMGVKLIDPAHRSGREAFLYDKVVELSVAAKLPVVPEVGIYESDEINAFATGPTKRRALVAVSTGLLRKMSDGEIEGVLAHEVAHIANGDMVTMTLLQGVINAFVMFFARIAAFFVGQMVEEEKRSLVQFGVTFVLEILLGFLGMIAMASFSRHREYRADAGGARLSSSQKMIAALRALQRNSQNEPQAHGQQSMAYLKISSSKSRFVNIFASHPELSDRIKQLESQMIGVRAS